MKINKDNNFIQQIYFIQNVVLNYRNIVRKLNNFIIFRKNL